MFGLVVVALFFTGRNFSYDGRLWSARFCRTDAFSVFSDVSSVSSDVSSVSFIFLAITF